MIWRISLLCLTISTITIEAEVGKCNIPSTVIPLKYDYGSINPFLNIATGMSRGLVPEPSADTLKEIGRVISGSDTDYTTLVSNLAKENAGAIVFACVSVVFAVACLVCLIVVCIGRFMCGTCGADGFHNPNRSKVPLFINLGLVGVCLAFLIAGGAIYWQSVDQLYTRVNKDVWGNVADITKDAGNFVTDTSTSLTCVVEEDTDVIVAQATNLLDKKPEAVFDNFLEETGISQISTWNSKNIERKLLNLKTLFTESDAKLQKLKTLPKDQEEIGNELKLVKAAELVSGETFAKIEPLLTEMDAVSGDVNDNIATAKGKMSEAIAEAKNTLNKIQSTIKSTTNDISDQTKSIKEQLTNINEQINSHRGDLEDSSLLRGIHAGFLAIGIIPLAIAAIFMGLALCGGSGSLLFSSSPGRRGILNAFGCSTMLGVYLLFVVGIVVFLITLASYAGGFATSAVCKPVFKDKEYKLFGASSIFSYNITTIDGSGSTVSLANFLENCPTNTVFGAMGGTNLISKNAIMAKANTSQQQGEVMKVVEDIHFNVNIDANKVTEFENAVTAFQTATKDFLAQQQFLPNTEAANPNNKDVEDAISSLQSAQKSTKEMADILSNYSEIANKLQTQSTDELKKPIIQGMNGLFTEMNDVVSGGVDELLSDLLKKAAPCAPLKQIFDNVGAIVCDGFGKSVNGVWAAIGLAAIFILPAAFLMIYLSGWMYNQRVLDFDQVASQPYGVAHDEFSVIPRPYVTGPSSNNPNWDMPLPTDSPPSTGSRLKRF